MTLVEVTCALLIVSVLLVAALSAVTGAARGRKVVSKSVRAQLLAEELMEEILEKDYADDEYPQHDGPEPGEADAYNRLEFDDVDDYGSWYSLPPRDRHGNKMTDLVGWRRTVLIDYVTPDDVEVSGPASSGLKRIRVEVYEGLVLRKQLVAIRAKER